MSEFVVKKKSGKSKKRKEKVSKMPNVRGQSSDQGIISKGWKSAIVKLTTQQPALSEVSDDPPETESSEEELDLTKDCFPISHYMNDRTEMINQMFSVIKGKKLKAMLPPILADIDLEQLKLLCLDQLLGVSEKRIQCILEGEILDSSSESEVLSEESDSSKSQKGSPSSSGNESQPESHGSSKRKRGRRKSDAESSTKVAKFAKVSTEQGPDEGKTLLEILELEMRARAIRALLNQGNDPSKANPPQKGDVVDLTENDEDEFPRPIKIEPVSSQQEISFAEKVESAKAKEEAVAKTRRMLLETEMRNRLIKKKTYRTRQQRLENEEEEATKIKEAEVAPPIEIVEVKQEPSSEPVEVVIEDPEEGEVSSEDEVEASAVVKEEKEDSPEPEVVADKVMDGERIMAIDDGDFVVNENVEFEEGHDSGEVEIIQEDSEAGITEEMLVEEGKESVEEPQDVTEESQDSTLQAETEEESWRERWLMNDEVQKVFKSSKVLGKAKKRRIASKKKVDKEKETAAEEQQAEPQTQQIELEGSVSEYQQLFGKQVEESSEVVPRREVLVGKPVRYNVPAAECAESAVGTDEKTSQETTSVSPEVTGCVTDEIVVDSSSLLEQEVSLNNAQRESVEKEDPAGIEVAIASENDIIMTETTSEINEPSEDKEDCEVMQGMQDIPLTDVPSGLEEK